MNVMQELQKPFKACEIERNKNGTFKRRNIRFHVDGNDCFVCNSHAPRGNNNYPAINIGGKMVSAHRHIYEQCFGLVGQGEIIMHTCDNPACINPGHLRAGTQTENIQDRVNKKRSAVGEKSGRAKLKRIDVDYITNNPDNLSAIQLSNKYGISRRHVYHLWNGDAWNHLGGE